MYIFVRLFFVFQLLFFFTGISAQFTIKGKVTDAYTNEPVAYANVIFKGTTTGITTDFNGEYVLHGKKADSLYVSFLGYETRVVAISDTARVIDVQLNPSVYELDEIVVRPGENPAHRILRRVWEANDKNNTENLEAFQYENYSRSTIFFRKFNYKDSVSIIRPLKKEFKDYSVSTGDEGIPALPGYISESVSDVYYLRFPKHEFVNIRAVNSKGLAFENTDMVSQLTSKQVNFNFFNNSVPVIDKSFVSPLSRFGLIYYKYYLIDSMFIDNHFCFEIHVVPKHKESPVFKGSIWITDTTFALKRISVEVDKKADLNFIQRIKIQQDYEPFGSAWFPVKTRFMADASNIYITGYSEKRDIIVNQPKNLSFYDRELKMDLEGYDYADDFWQKQRENSFEHLDSLANHRLKDLKNIRKISLTSKLIEAGIKGYYNFGSFEAGPYLLLYGYNNVEGSRIRVGGRTNNNLGKRIILEGYIAYGFGDEKMKGSMQTDVFLRKKSWTKAGIQYRNDIEHIGSIDEFYSKDAFLSLASNFGGTNKLAWSETIRGWLESDFFNDLNGKLVFTRKTFEPVSPDFYFAYLTETKSVSRNSYVSGEIGISLNYHPKVTYVLDGLRRFPVNFNKYPSFTVDYFMGIKGLLNSDFNYRKISAGIFHNFTMGALGMMVYDINFSHVFDPLPYPMLNILSGNQSVFRSNRTYNLMNYGEFVSSETLELFYSYHMDGLILNRIPLIKKLNWRTVTTGHFAFGSFGNENGIYDPVTNPEGIIPRTDAEGNEITRFYTITYKKPYAELSYGIENIFKFFRIDLIQRLNYLNNPDVKQFGLKLSGVFRF